MVEVVELIRAAGNADIVPGVPFTPEIYDSEQERYYKICGHFFWADDNQGATIACRQLGFLFGQVITTEVSYETDAMPVGGCKAGEDLRRYP